MCTYILVDVEACTCRSRGAHVACTRTYSGQCATKKIWPRMYIRAGSLTPTCAYIRTARARVHGWVRTEKQRRRRVHGRQRNASCSSGGNGTRGSQPFLDGTTDGNEAWRTAERRKRPCVRPATVKTGSCLSGGACRTSKWRKRTSLGPPMVEMGSC